MANKYGIMFSKDPNTPINVKIQDFIKANDFSEEAVIRFAHDMYTMGNEGGQEFVWKMRSGDFTTTFNHNLKWEEVHSSEKDEKWKTHNINPHSVKMTNGSQSFTITATK